MIKCTIAIPVYNRKNKSLNHVALESALAQQFQDLEILVVDDCSTDGTWDLLKTYHDPRLRLVRNKHNMGLFGNFNRCLQLAQGKYFRLLCSDDKLVSNCLMSEIDLMERHENVVLLSTYGRRVDTHNHALGMQANHFPPGIYAGEMAILGALWFQAHYAINPFNYPSGVLFRRCSALLAGKFNTSMRMSGDVDYFLRVLQHGDLGVVGSIGCEITVHADQEGAGLASDTVVMREIIEITECYRPLLQQYGVYQRIRHQLTAYALGLAFKYWRLRLLDAAKSHWTLAWKLNITPWGAGVGILRLLFLRLLMRVSGKRLMPSGFCARFVFDKDASNYIQRPTKSAVD